MLRTIAGAAIGFAALLFVSLPSAPFTGTAAAQACDPNYLGPCLPVYTGTDNVNCTDHSVITMRSFPVVGTDVYHLDADHDGFACDGETSLPAYVPATVTPTVAAPTATPTSPAPTSTTVPPTATSAPPTATAVPATATATTAPATATATATRAVPAPPNTGTGSEGGSNSSPWLALGALVAAGGGATYLVRRRK